MKRFLVLGFLVAAAACAIISWDRRWMTQCMNPRCRRLYDPAKSNADIDDRAVFCSFECQLDNDERETL